MTAKATSSKVAIATPVNATVYNVRYVGSPDLDRDVSYAYLRSLAAKGWEVRVDGVADTPAHVIPAAK